MCERSSAHISLEFRQINVKRKRASLVTYEHGPPLANRQIELDVERLMSAIEILCIAEFPCRMEEEFGVQWRGMG